jgi:hypothetical protein
MKTERDSADQQAGSTGSNHPREVHNQYHHTRVKIGKKPAKDYDYSVSGR